MNYQSFLDIDYLTIVCHLNVCRKEGIDVSMAGHVVAGMDEPRLRCSDAVGKVDSLAKGLMRVMRQWS